MQTPPLSRSGLDRDHRLRSGPDVLETALADPRTRAVVVEGDAVRTTDDGAVALLAPCDAPSGTAVWLGVTPEGETRVAIIAASGTDSEPADAPRAGLRELAGRIPDADLALCTQAVAMAAWHRDHGFSPVDGSPTSVEEAGWVRRDGAGRLHFPRTDPAVIVLITDPAGDRVLLGRNAAWAAERFSLLAGFVDPGESLEAAAAREVFEESQVRLASLRYVASQPWPFPRSLMVGFRAVAEDPASATPDGAEIVELRWLTREQVRAGAVALPGAASIARAMIDAWLAE